MTVGQDTDKEIFLEPREFSLPYFPMDLMEERLHQAHTIINHCEDDIRNYAISLYKFYEHWGYQRHQDIQGRIFNMQQAYGNLQDHHDEILAMNAILRLELGQTKHSLQCLSEQLQQYQNAMVTKHAVMECLAEGISENSSCGSGFGPQKKRRRRKRNKLSGCPKRSSEFA